MAGHCTGGYFEQTNVYSGTVIILFVNFIFPFIWVGDFFIEMIKCLCPSGLCVHKPHRNLQVPGKKWTWHWYKPLCCAQESALLPLTGCCAAKFVSCPTCPAVLQPCAAADVLVSLLLQLGIRSTPDKMYFKGKESQMRLVPAPVDVFTRRTVLRKNAEDRELLLPVPWCYRKWMILFCYPPWF